MSQISSFSTQDRTLEADFTMRLLPSFITSSEDDADFQDSRHAVICY